MAAYKKARQLSQIDAAYIAGLVDGEGTVTLGRKHAGENRQLVVSISNTEVAILDYVLEAVGAGKVTRKRTAAANHTPSLTYAVWNRQALSLLEQIEPHLRSYKGQRAQLIIADYVRLTPRNGKYGAGAKEARDAFAHKVLEIRPTPPGAGRSPQVRGVSDCCRVAYTDDACHATGQKFNFRTTPASPAYSSFVP